MRVGIFTAALVASLATGSLATADPAAATMTSSSVRVVSPAGTFVTYDEVTGAQTMSVVGTSNGLPSEDVDINCYSANKRYSLAQGVEIQADGSFSFSGSFKALASQTCVLRAVPQGDTTDYAPGSSSGFLGPTLAIGRRGAETVANGPNKGALLWYYLFAPQLAGAFDYRSLGNCSILDSYAYDPVTFASSKLDDCNATLWWQNGATGFAGIAAPTRSEIQVDGMNAYLPGNAAEVFAGASNNAGFPALRYRYEIDPATGGLVLEETDQIVRCSPQPAVYPPTPASCSSFAPTGIEAYMAITQGSGGRVAAVTQWFYSTDGSAHSLDLLEENEFAHIKGDGLLDLPWVNNTFAKYFVAGQQLPAAPSAPGSFFVKGSATVPDGGEESPQGAVTFSNAPEGETIVGSTINPESWVNLHYRRTVPSSGAVALGFTYSNGFLFSEVQGDAAAAQAAYVPKVAISAPGAGTVSARGQVTVTGTATDATALSSLVVGGRSVAVAPNGSFSATVPLRLGANTITAVATNVFGNSAQAQTSVSYLPVALRIAGKARTSGKRGPRGALFTITCQAPPGSSCDGVGALTTTEFRHGKRLYGLAARRRARRRPSPNLSTITVGKRSFAIPAGQTQTIFVALNKAGKRLLARFRKLPVTLSITLTNGESGAPALVGRSALMIKPAAKPAARRAHRRSRGRPRRH